MKTLFIFTAALLSSAILHADSTFEHKTFMGNEPGKVWTSGLKQRKEMSMPMVGKQISITRVDKGVEWTLNTKKKTYTEEKLALPYTPMEKSSTKTSGGNSNEDEDEDTEPTCTPQMTSLSKTRTIAGMTAKGTHMGCKESPKEGMTLWYVPPTATIKAAEQDLKNFDAALAKAKFANWPAKERKEMERGLAMWARLIGELPMAMTGQKLPSDFLIAMDMTSEEGPQTFYEVTALSAGSLDASLFEIPAGYKKVEAKTGAFGDVDLGEMMKGLKDFSPK